MGLFGKRRDAGPEDGDQETLDLMVNHCYWIAYDCRDIGYGPESGDGEFVYRGPYDEWGKHEFTPVGGGPALYLFADEVTDVEGES